MLPVLCRSLAFKWTVSQEKQKWNKKAGFPLQVLFKLYNPLTTFPHNDFHFLFYFVARIFPFVARIFVARIIYRTSFHPFAISWACLTNEFVLVLCLTFTRALKSSSHFRTEHRSSELIKVNFLIWVFPSDFCPILLFLKIL